METAPKTNRILKVDANVIAYFGDFFLSVERGLRVSAAPLNPVHTAPRYTAFSQSRS
jgi:hypothetical protein